MKAESLNFIVLKPNLSVLWSWLLAGQHQLAQVLLPVSMLLMFLINRVRKGRFPYLLLLVISSSSWEKR